jgi:hypothetical protein
MPYQPETPILAQWLYHNLFIIYFNASFLIDVIADRFPKPWIAVECVCNNVIRFYYMYLET